MIAYSITTTPDDDGTLLVTCDQLPEVTTFASSPAQIAEVARLAIEEGLAARIAGWEDIPLPADDPADTPSPNPSNRLSLLVTMKLALYLACRRADITRAELARRLGWHREQVDRLFRLEHASRIDQLEAAFAALGATLDIELRPAA